MSDNLISFYGSICEDGLFGSFTLKGNENLINILSILKSLSVEEQKGLILRIQNNIKRLKQYERLYKK